MKGLVASGKDDEKFESTKTFGVSLSLICPANLGTGPAEHPH